MEIIAHRGASFDAPENSLEAFRVAAAQGAERIELDVHVTRDGVPVVIHDDDTERVGDRVVAIHASTLEQVRGVRLHNGEPIPTLDEACATAADLGLSLDLELKTSDSLFVVNLALSVARNHGLADTLLLTSFSPEMLAEARRLGYGGRCGLIVGSRSVNPKQRAFEAWPFPTVEAVGATDLIMHHKLVHPLLRRGVTRRSLGLVTWMSMDDERRPPDERARDYVRLRYVKPDGVIVARVREASAVLAAFAGASADG